MGKQIVKHIISLGLLILSCTLASAQISLEIDELRISKYNLSKDYNEFSEDHWTGPTINFEGSLTNASESPIILDAIRDSIILSFNFKNNRYRTYEVSFFLGDDLSRPLDPGEVLPIWFASHIFLGTGIAKNPAADFREILMQVLPTLKVQYYIKAEDQYISNSKVPHVELFQ